MTAAAAAAAAQTAVNGALIDTQGFDSITGIASLGAITAGGTGVFKAQGGDDAGGNDLADLEGASVAIVAGYANENVAIEIHRPKHRYIKFIVTRATQDSALNGIFALRYGASHTPVDNANVAAKVALVTPDVAS